MTDSTAVTVALVQDYWGRRTSFWPKWSAVSAILIHPSSQAASKPSHWCSQPCGAMEEEVAAPPTDPVLADYFPTGHPAMIEYGKLFKLLTRRWPTHLPPVPVELPAGVTHPKWVRCFLLHYPPGSETDGYYGKDGQATCDTTRELEKTCSSACGHQLVLGQCFDLFMDLYDGAHETKVGKSNFSFTPHFFNKLKKADQERWRQLKIKMIASVLVD